MNVENQMIVKYENKKNFLQKTKQILQKADFNLWDYQSSNIAKMCFCKKLHENTQKFARKKPRNYAQFYYFFHMFSFFFVINECFDQTFFYAIEFSA